jgi:hypothetical protein
MATRLGSLRKFTVISGSIDCLDRMHRSEVAIVSDYVRVVVGTICPIVYDDTITDISSGLLYLSITQA